MSREHPPQIAPPLPEPGNPPPMPGESYDEYSRRLSAGRQLAGYGSLGTTTLSSKGYGSLS